MLAEPPQAGHKYEFAGTRHIRGNRPRICSAFVNPHGNVSSFVRKDGETTIKTPIQTGRTNYLYTEIKSAGTPRTGYPPARVDDMLIRIEGLRKSYSMGREPVPVLNGIDLSISIF